MRRTPILGLVLVGCTTPAPAPVRPAPTTIDAAAPVVANVPTPPDPPDPLNTRDLDASASVEVDAGPPIARPTPTEPPLVFRRMMVGMLPYPGTRETWSLERYESELVVRMLIDESYAMTRASGAEREAKTWSNNVGEVVWSGRVVDLHATSTLRLESKRGSWGTRAKRVPPGMLKMQCKTIDLSVLAATAKLVPGDACGNGGKKPAWVPATKTRTKVERCTFADLDPDDGEGDGWGGRPSFAKEPGVEWVFENSDCSAQEGAYRLIAPPKP